MVQRIAENQTQLNRHSMHSYLITETHYLFWLYRWLMDPVIYSLKFYPATPLSVSHFCHVRLFVTLWTIAHQPTLSMGFSRQEDWSWLPFPSPGDLPDPGIEPRSPALQADSLPTELWGKPNGSIWHPMSLSLFASTLLSNGQIILIEFFIFRSSVRVLLISSVSLRQLFKNRQYR